MNGSPLPDALSGDALRILLIGAGKMGAAHAAAFKAVTGAEVVGVVSQGGASAERLAAQYRLPHWGTDWRQVAEISQAEAAVVAVAHAENESVTRAVIEQGLHTLAEKPVSLQPARVRALAEAAREQGVIAMVGMNRRFYPSVTAALQLVRFYGLISGITVNAPDPVGPYRATHKYPASVYDHWTEMNTLHAIDLLRLAGGEVAAVSGWKQHSPSNDEHSIVASIQFAGGILGSFNSYGSHSGQWELRLHGEGVEAILSPLEQGTLRLGNAAPFALPSSADRKFKPGLRQQAQAFVDAVRDLGYVAAPGSDFFDHAETLALVDRLMNLPAVMLEASEPGQARITDARQTNPG